MSIAGAILCAVLAGPASRMPPLEDATARAHAERAQQHWAAGELAEASAELAAAHAIEPLPELLAARGKVEHELGNCESAVELFARYLESSPPERQANVARSHIDACGGPSSDAPSIDEPPPPAPREWTPIEAVEPAPSDDAASRAEPAARPWWRDRLGGALVGSGAVLLGLGVGLRVGAAIVERSADDASHDAFVGDLRRAVALERAAYPIIAAGGAVLLGGVIRWVVVARRDGTARASGGPRLRGLTLRF